MKSQSDPEICALCVAVADATGGPDTFLHNRRLAETPNFVVVPTPGPLVPGHVMVVSKAHHYSLAGMGDDAIREYDDLAQRLRSAPFLRDDPPLEAEHGSTQRDKAGACVIHTHVHWIPGMGQYFRRLAEKLPPRPEPDLKNFGVSHAPYIFLRAAGEQAVFDAQGFPSQMIRRLLCELLDRDDTDWTQNLRLDWVKETVQAWARLEKNL